MTIQTAIRQVRRYWTNLVNDKSKEMAEELMRKVTVAELAQEMQMDEEEIRDAIKLSANHMEYIEEDAEL